MLVASWQPTPTHRFDRLCVLGSRRPTLLTIILCLIACAPAGCGDSKKGEEGRAQLAQRVAEQLQAAKAKADAYDFDSANAILRDLPEEVDKSPFVDVATYDKLTADVEAIRRTVSEQETRYRKKIRTGWKLVDGRLVSPAEQRRALTQEKRRQEKERRKREEEAKRKAEERRMAQARAKTEAEAREKEKRRRRAAARVAEATRFLSQKRLGFGSINPVGDGELLVGWKHSTVYVAANAGDLLSHHPSYGVFFVTAFREASGQFAEPAAGFFRVNGRPEKVTFQSDDENIVHVYDDGSAGFKNPGRANVRVTLAGKTVAVPITVIQLPVDSGMYDRGTPADDVIRLIGLPDDKKKHYISWPDSEIIDGIYYGSSDPRWGIATEHWKFNKYPGAVLAIVANCVYAVATYAERQEPQVFLP